MRRLLLTLFAILLCSCAVVSQKPDGSLYDTYRRYRDAVAAGSIVDRREEFFTQKVLGELDVASEKDVKSLRVGASISAERSHYEKSSADRGCLTVNGYGKNGDPVSLFIEYRAIQGKWLTDHTNIHLPGKEVFKGFFEEALCPDEAHQKVMREFEQGR